VAVGASEAVGAPHPPAPVVKKIKLASGPLAGGVKVTLKGANLTGATKVLFGRAKGTHLVVKSAHKLTILAPRAKRAGVVHVRVVTPAGKSAKTKRDRFTYADPQPVVSSLAPNTGTRSGGTVVTVTGSGLTGATTVTFDGIAGTALQVTSSTSLTVTTPAHDIATVDVRVVTPFGTSAVVPADHFDYVYVPPVAT